MVQLIFAIRSTKTIMIRLTLIFLLILTVTASKFIIEPKNYLMKVHENVVNQLKLNAEMLTVEDISVDIIKNSMGKKFEGKVTFFSSFVNRIGKFELNNQTNVEAWNDTFVS